MKFVVRPGTTPHARADGALLSSMGLPGGGVVSLGRTHVLVRPGTTTGPNVIEVPPDAMANSDLRSGASADIRRVNLPTAQAVVVAGDRLPIDARHLARALQGRPVTVGDRITVDSSYDPDDAGTPIEIEVADVLPGPAGLIGSGTVVTSQADHSDNGETTGAMPTMVEALLAGLDAEVDLATGWLTLLTGPGNLPAAWGLPAVAGILLEGPAGCGKSELVAAAAARAGCQVHEVTLDLVFKPERVLDHLEQAVRSAVGPTVVFVDRIDAVAGSDGMFRTQVAAIMRWFLDAIASKPGVACVLGVSSVSHLDASVARSELLPRTLSIPPPDLERRRRLLEASVAKVPTAEIDFEKLAARTAGFSGADIVAAVVHASAVSAGSGEPLTTDTLLDAVGGITPSLGSVPTGEMPSYGFEKVANLVDVKQRLTEAVIWPMTEPERFARLGIDPPRGILLWGPPGTGKTYVVRALAHESGAAFFSIKGAELLDKYVGESERGVREVFARARAAAPSILFFDELDALAPVRGRSTTSVTDSVVAALLTELDGVGERGDVVVIGATNRRDLIDPALLRGGRFEAHIELGLPEPEARKALIGITDIPFAADVDTDQLVAMTEGLSFADMTSVFREAALQALRRDPAAMEVSLQDLTDAVARLRSGSRPDS